MLRVCGDAELLATEPLLYGALPGPAGQGGCAVSSALAWQLWGALDVTGLELELDGERYTVRGVFESGEARAVTQEAVDSRTAEYANVELTAMETAPEGTEAALAFAGASGLGTPAHVVDGPALAGLACALCWLPLALCGACTLWRLARGARRLRPWQRQTLLFAALLFLPELSYQRPESGNGYFHRTAGRHFFRTSGAGGTQHQPGQSYTLCTLDCPCAAARAASAAHSCHL